MTLPVTPATTHRGQQKAPCATDQRGLTLRSFFVCLFALLLMGAWIEYQECYRVGGPFAENAPPNSAVAVVLILLLISGLLYLLRKTFALRTQELVFIYAALLIAAPLMTQGMWHRFFGLVTAVPHYRDFKSYESLPPMLWPHGENLVVNGRFVKGLDGFTLTPNGTCAWDDVEWKGRKWHSPVLTGNTDTAIQFSIARFKGKKEILVAGESFLFSGLVKAADFQATSSYYVKMRADDGPWTTLYTGTRNSEPTFANRGGFERIGVTPLVIPKGLRQQLTLAVGLTGPGRLTVQDLQFFNNMAVEGMFAGRRVVQQKHAAAMGDDERTFLQVKPDSIFSWAGIVYLVTAYVPWGQWVMPLLAWSLLIGALFLGFLSFNIIMRKHWVENERLTFPLNIFPRYLFGEETTSVAEALKVLCTNRLVWAGFATTAVLVTLKCIHFYYPSIPAPAYSEMWSIPALDAYVENPNLKALLSQMRPSLTFSLLAITLMIETETLFSLWCGYFLFQFMFMFGKMFNWNRYAGYPWEWQQAIGSFTAYALLGIFAARKHLTRVVKSLLGRKDIDDSQEVVSYRAAVLFLIIAALMLVLWGVWTKMGAWVSLLFFGWLLLCGFSASKIRAECGMPFAYWMPYYGLFFVSAIGGFAVFGTTGMLVATIASGFMCTSCFLFLAPVQVEMMELGRHFRVRPRDIGAGLTMGLIGGIFIGGFVLLTWAYGMGGDNMRFQWPYSQNWYFTGYRQGEMAADRGYATALNQHRAYTPPPDSAPLNVVKNPVNVDAKGVLIGGVVTSFLAVLRSLFVWFPIHPIGYVLAATYFGRTMWFTLLLAWLTRIIVLRIGGAHAIRRGLVPFAVGMFLACVVSIIVFDILGLYLQSCGITQVYATWP